MNQQLYIVTGASGKLGEEFINTLKKTGKEVLGLSRKKSVSEADRVLLFDLLDTDQTTTALKKEIFLRYSEIYLIHTVGKFKFENGKNTQDDDGDGIDDEVFATNVLTLKNIIEPLLSTIERQRLVICVFASVSDRHDVPYWASYTRAKNILRKYLQALCSLEKVSAALVVNVSTVDTGNESILRPLADKTYWLKPEEIVNKTLPLLGSIQTYTEIDVTKEKPDFDEKYYLDHGAILEKWHKEMGI